MLESHPLAFKSSDFVCFTLYLCNVLTALTEGFVTTSRVDKIIAFSKCCYRIFRHSRVHLRRHRYYTNKVALYWKTPEGTPECPAQHKCLYTLWTPGNCSSSRVKKERWQTRFNASCTKISTKRTKHKFRTEHASIFLAITFIGNLCSFDAGSPLATSRRCKRRYVKSQSVHTLSTASFSHIGFAKWKCCLRK